MKPYIHEGECYYPPELFGAGYSNYWDSFPDEPGQCKKYKTYWVKWDIQVDNQQGYKKINTYFSDDKGKHWFQFDLWIDRGKPFYKKLIKEAIEDKKEKTKERNRIKSKERREQLKKGAEEAGISLEEYKLQKSKKRKEKLKEKNQKEAARKLSNGTNKKIKLASSLKELLEVGMTLQQQLLDGEELNLRYLNNRIHKIDEATKILEKWTTRKN